jgi:hypothetical protein
MSPSLRAVTLVAALVYFGASLYHSGLATPVQLATEAPSLGPASIAELILGLVLIVGAAGIIRSPLVTYVVVLAGTLFGLTIVVLRGLLGIDLGIHVAMLAVIAVGFALIFGERGRIRST